MGLVLSRVREFHVSLVNTGICMQWKVKADRRPDVQSSESVPSCQTVSWARLLNRPAPPARPPRQTQTNRLQRWRRRGRVDRSKTGGDGVARWALTTACQPAVLLCGVPAGEHLFISVGAVFYVMGSQPRGLHQTRLLLSRVHSDKLNWTELSRVEFVAMNTQKNSTRLNSLSFPDQCDE